MPVRRRFDVVLIFAVFGLFFLFALVWGIGVLVGERFGFFDEPVIKSVSDQRIRANIRDDLYKSPLLDAVWSQGDRQVLISKKGGTLHRYNPVARLWETELPGLTTNLRSPDLHRLRAGNGAAPLSYRAQLCPDPQTLWGVSSDGGLLRRVKGQWRQVIGDTFFRGSRGAAVSKGQLTAAAVSETRQWLLLGTKEDGIGLYDLPEQRWITLPDELFKALPSASVSHIAWWQNRFWLAGPSGLTALEIHDPRHPPSRKSAGPIAGSIKQLRFPLSRGLTVTLDHPHLDGNIIDLDVDLENRLWVLERRECANQQKSHCLRLSRYVTPQSPPDTLIDQKNAYPNLRTGDLFFAQYWDDRLIVAGEAGLFSYDTNRHNWLCHHESAVLCVLPFPRKDGFYFGYNGGVGLVAKGISEPWDQTALTNSNQLVSIPRERVVKLRFGLKDGLNDEILALCASGKVYALREGKSRAIFEGNRTAFDLTKLVSAMAFGDNVLFLGPKGVLVHNIATRSYKDLPTSQVPEWLFQRGLKSFASGETIYIALTRQQNSVIYRIPTAVAAEGDFKSIVYAATVPGTLNKIRDWDQQGIVVLAGSENREVLRFSPDKETLIGPGFSGFQNIALRDVAPYRDGLLAATSQGLHYYDYNTRSWEPRELPAGATPVEVAGFKDQVVATTSHKRLVKFNPRGEAVGVIGGSIGFHFTDRQLSDVMEVNGKLYLAGSGKVYLYDPALRQVTQQWELPGRGEVKIKGIIDNNPLVLCDSRANLGSRTIEPEGGAVTNLSLDKNYLWTVRTISSGEHRGQKFLKRYPLGSPRSKGESFFSKPGAGLGASTIFDAAQLPQKTIAAATDAGLRFYSTHARTWLKSYPLTWVPRGDRLHFLDNFLVVTDSGQRLRSPGSLFELTFVKLNTLNLGDGFSSQEAQFKAPPQRTRVRAYTLAHKIKGAAFIDESGRVMEWRGGVQQEVLAAPQNAPIPSQLRRVYHRDDTKGNYLVFTTRGSLFLYHLDTHRWREILIKIGDGQNGEPLANINVENRGNREIVTARTVSGKFFLGAFHQPDSASTSINVNLQMEVVSIPSAGFNSPGDPLRDVQQRNGDRWTFVLTDRLKYFNPQKRLWHRDVLFPDAAQVQGPGGKRGIAAYAHAGGRGILEAVDSRTYWVAKTRGPHPNVFARYQVPAGHSAAVDRDGVIWQLAPDGRLFRLGIPVGNRYNQPPTPYEQPFILPAGRIQKAFKWGSLHLFVTSEGLQVLDTAINRPLSLPGAAQGITQIRDVLYHGTRLFLLYNGGVAVLRQENSNRLQIRLEPGGTLLAVSPKGRLWARFQNTWRVWLQNNTFGAPFGGLTQPPEPSGGTIVDSQWNSATTARRIENQWADLQKNTHQLPNGQTAFAPIIRLETGIDGQLIARRPLSSERLSARAVILGKPNLNATSNATSNTLSNQGASFAAALPASLDAGWLKWDRQKHVFQVQTPDGPLALSPKTFIKEGKLLFETVDALLVPDQNDYYAANRHGVWQYPGMDFSLTNPGIRFRPVSWSRPTAALEGRFICGNKGYNLNGSPLPPAAVERQFTIGQVTFTQNLSTQSVSAVIKNGRQTVNAFAARGFKWDSGRREIFYAPQNQKGTNSKGNQLMIRSDAGFHPAVPLRDFVSQRTAQMRAPQQTLSGEGGPVNRVLIDNETWTWEKRGGSVRIRLKKDAHNFRTVGGPGGIGFSADRLVDAVAFENRLYVITGASLEIFDNASQADGFLSRRYPRGGSTRFQVITEADGKKSLFRFSPGGTSYWNSSANRFEAVTARNNPQRPHLLAQTPGERSFLRFTRIGEGIRKELKLKTLEGKETWVPFRFTDGRFPCDVVNSIASDQNYLYVGTGAGLQCYPAPLDTGLRSMAQCYDLRGPGGGLPEGVLKVGRPLAHPAVIMARSRYNCIKTAGDDVFERCLNPGVLGLRLRLQTKTWQFIDRSGYLDGRYQTQNGRYNSPPITLQGGRFPHDRILDLAVFDGKIFTLWRNGWLSIHPDLSMTFNDNVIHQDWRRFNPRRFIVLPQEIYMGAPGNIINSSKNQKEIIPKGIYMESHLSRRIYHYSEGAWLEVARPDMRKRLLDFIDRPPLVNRPRLRLHSPGIYFEYRRSDGVWQKLPWEQGRVAIDNWSEFFFLDNRLWAATAAGLTRFSRTSSGRVILDAAKLDILDVPGNTGGKGKTSKQNNLYQPEITDVQLNDNIVTIRCNADSKQVFQGTFSTPLPSPAQLWKPLDFDPFAQREWVTVKESGFWDWRLKGRRDHNPGWLEGRFRGEEIRFVAGRFEMDTINSLAFFLPNRVEIGTHDAGWFRAVSGDLALKDINRPSAADIDATEVKEVFISRQEVEPQAGKKGIKRDVKRVNEKNEKKTEERGSEKYQPILGLKVSDGFVRVTPKGLTNRTRGCPRFLGDDGFWQYAKTGDNVVITTPYAHGGEARRSIMKGRFTDNIVSGLPIAVPAQSPGNRPGNINETETSDSNGKTGEKAVYLIPTLGGVVHYNAHLQPESIHVGPFPGLAPDRSPTVLYYGPDKEVAKVFYVAKNVLRNLEGAREPHSGGIFQVPEGAAIDAVENGPHDLVRVRWRNENKRGWNLSQLDVSKQGQNNIIFIDISHFDKYIKNREKWGSPAPWLQVHIEDRQLQVFAAGTQENPKGYTLPLPEKLKLLNAIVVKKHLYLITTDDLWQVNLEQLTEKCFEAPSRAE